ncbi:unnamed protein product [Cercopithifilaria johnstoni]|uniref:ZP domain-containing protein n=1 Tax=Cercopithifilaria johnstoni TaxID=2874296 RepID=A0A8J2LS62_9BILA|nr:unnamed protein product [Cercopithifilaria johnstoni]
MMTQQVASATATLSISLLLLIQAIIHIQRVHSIPIPNSQIGKAEVECGEDTIEVVFLTESVFQGRVYVVGHSNDGRCVSRDTGRRTTSITVRKDQCGVAITRSRMILNVLDEMLLSEV